MQPLSFDEARDRVVAASKPLSGIDQVQLSEAGGRVLAQDVFADDDYPRFDNSAVDGYAVGRLQDADCGVRLALAGLSSAGGGMGGPIEPGMALRVLTGAHVPDGTFGVAMQEDVTLSDGCVTLAAPIRGGQHIRERGSEIREGDLLLPAGHRISPGAIALLALAGHASASVYRKPKLGVVTTGDELISAGCSPVASQIRDTNGPMLSELVRLAGAEVVRAVHVRDDLELLRDALASIAAEVDLIVVAGGASVGDRDYVPRVLADLGEVNFHGVSMRPGKPLLFGRIGEALVFGLPGNPASSFIGFKFFVLDAIRGLSGETPRRSPWLAARFSTDHEPAGREDFVRVVVEVRSGELWAVPVAEQASFGLRSLAESHAVARLSGVTRISVGDSCPVLMFNP